jgi:antitoxin component YwqK of YwqJK toxin-antitoxin module
MLFKSTNGKSQINTVALIIVHILILSSCTYNSQKNQVNWILKDSEELINSMWKLTYTDNHGRTRIVEQNPDGNIWKEIISVNNQVISDLTWYENGSKQHEVLFEGKKCIKDITWYQNEQKNRENLFKNGICYENLVWYPTGQLSEKNDYDKNGKYVLAQRWYQNGKIKYDATFQNGIVTKQTFYNEDGSIDYTNSVK